MTLYQCWLDEVYGRSEAKKFWDHMSTLDGLQDALDVVGFVWDGAAVINMVISLCRGEPKEALAYLVCAIPVFGSFLRKGGKWLKSAGMDLVTKGIGKGEDLVSSLRVTYRVTADKVAGMQKYLDDVFEQMAACRMGNGQYRLCFAGGYLDDSSRFVYEIYDDAGETLSRISRMDEMQFKDKAYFDGEKRDFFVKLRDMILKHFKQERELNDEIRSQVELAMCMKRQDKVIMDILEEQIQWFLKILFVDDLAELELQKNLKLYAQKSVQNVIEESFLYTLNRSRD